MHLHKYKLSPRILVSYLLSIDHKSFLLFLAPLLKMPRAKLLGFSLPFYVPPPFHISFPLLSCRAICGLVLLRAQLQLCLPGQALVWTNTPDSLLFPMHSFCCSSSSPSAVLPLSSHFPLPTACLPWTSSILCSFLSWPPLFPFPSFLFLLSYLIQLPYLAGKVQDLHTFLLSRVFLKLHSKYLNPSSSAISYHRMSGFDLSKYYPLFLGWALHLPIYVYDLRTVRFSLLVAARIESHLFKRNFHFYSFFVFSRYTANYCSIIIENCRNFEKKMIS